MGYTYDKRRSPTAHNGMVQKSQVPSQGMPFAAFAGMPNSARLAFLGLDRKSGIERDANSSPRSIMRSGASQPWQIAEIPAAEQEADNLSKGVTGTTPEQVKQEMGERLGSDFSSVRFHSDSSSVAQADSMGARAWAQGNDVFFGAGGFSPDVAAHELVHTVQQGSVSGDVSQSAPQGVVQMMPDDEDDKLIPEEDRKLESLSDYLAHVEQQQTNQQITDRQNDAEQHQSEQTIHVVEQEEGQHQDVSNLANQMTIQGEPQSNPPEGNQFFHNSKSGKKEPFVVEANDSVSQMTQMTTQIPNQSQPQSNSSEVDISSLYPEQEHNEQFVEEVNDFANHAENQAETQDDLSEKGQSSLYPEPKHNEQFEGFVNSSYYEHPIDLDLSSIEQIDASGGAPSTIKDIEKEIDNVLKRNKKQ